MKQHRARRRYFATNELKSTIRRQGRKASWFAEQIGVTQGHFSHVLHGRRDIGEDDARLIASVLGSDFSLLFDASDDARVVSNGAAA